MKQLFLILVACMAMAGTAQAEDCPEQAAHSAAEKDSPSSGLDHLKYARRYAEENKKIEAGKKDLNYIWTSVLDGTLNALQEELEKQQRKLKQ